MVTIMICVRFFSYEIRGSRWKLCISRTLKESFFQGKQWFDIKADKKGKMKKIEIVKERSFRRRVKK